MTNTVPQSVELDIRDQTIAIQRRGKLYDGSMQFVRSLGIEVSHQGPGLIEQCPTSGACILYLRDDDIPEYVARGAASMGIVGENVLAEKQAAVTIVRKLGFGQCRLVLAVPKDSPLMSLADLNGERIATSYPRVVNAFLKARGINAAIITIQGSVEVAPELNLADAICDIIQTGTTLQAHNLIELETVLESEAVLITQ